MQVSAEQLKQTYSEYTDEELTDLLHEKSLTDLAYEVACSEMRSRDLNPPPNAGRTVMAERASEEAKSANKSALRRFELFIGLCTAAVVGGGLTAHNYLHDAATGVVSNSSSAGSMHTHQSRNNSGVRYEKGSFSITLPVDWTEIPQNELREYEQRMHKLAPKAPIQTYTYGFQLAPSGNWFAFPYVLIKVNKKGAFSASDLSKLARYPTDSLLHALRDPLSTFTSVFDVGKMYYDKKSGIIWMKISATVNGVGPVTGLSGLVLTSQGYIQVNGSALTKDFQKYAPIFHSITTSISLSPNLAYHLR
jgi:hypothetical protein